MTQNNLKIFNVGIENYSKTEIENKINDALKNNRKLFIVTLNPEILLKAEKDKEYKNILNNSDLKIVDGFGLKLVAFIKGRKIGERIAGADLAEEILEQAKKLKLKIGFVFKKKGLSNKEDILKNSKFKIQNSKLFFLESKVMKEEVDYLISEINKTDIILVGLGAPEQEKFIWQIKNKLPNLRLVMGVGGTFDFWTGRQKRAPKFMRKIGLEWLWRLITQPKRFFRIWNASVVFLWKGLFLSKNK